MEAFVAQGLRKSYGEHVVLDGLDWTVKAGSIVGLIGVNGAGKSTLLRILLGLLPPDAGTTAISGNSSDGLCDAVRARIGYVPQSPGLFPWFSGGAMLRYVGSFYPSFDAEFAGTLCERWKISLGTAIGALSPGEQQKLSIVRALAARPDLLVFDEPMAALDPGTRIAVIDTLRAERQLRPLSVIFSSHLIGDLTRFCTHLAILAGGRIARFETIDDLRARAADETEAGELDLEASAARWMQ